MEYIVFIYKTCIAMEYFVSIRDLYSNGIYGFYTRLVWEWNLQFLYKTSVAMTFLASIEDLYSNSIYGFYRRLVL